MNRNKKIIITPTTTTKDGKWVNK